MALNCVANGKLLRENIFDGIWIQPAAGDAGGSVGAALSGGMDSSALVGVASRLWAPLRTFSAVYRDGDVMDERRYIAAVVAHTGATNYQVSPEAVLARSGPEGFTAFIEHHDEPVGGASIWAQHCVFALAAEHGVRVVLSGQGADESLTGYHGALSALVAEHIRRGDLQGLHAELAARAQSPQVLLRELVGGAFERVGARSERCQAADLRGRRLHAMAGIGRPERFFSQLEAMGLEIERRPFADHHVFTPADVAVPDGDVLLMTEKDAVKCAPFAPADSWVWPVRAQLAPGAVELILEKLDGPPTA